MTQEQKLATEAGGLLTPLLNTIWRPALVVLGLTLLGGGLFLGIWGLFSAGQEVQTAMIREMHERSVEGVRRGIRTPFRPSNQFASADELNAVRWREVVGGLVLFVGGGCLLVVGFRPHSAVFQGPRDHTGTAAPNGQHESGPPVELDWRSQPPPKAEGHSQ